MATRKKAGAGSSSGNKRTRGKTRPLRVRIAEAERKAAALKAYEQAALDLETAKAALLDARARGGR